ncbi:MAG: hypothetical protein IV100_03000 [Myxococcales bacterium]|nr:hypothetical protein [Myxococcales bacterium]
MNMAAETNYAVDPIADPTERMGRRAYTYARFEGLSANGFFACATCHIEGGDDGMTWFVVDGPRQTSPTPWCSWSATASARRTLTSRTPSSGSASTRGNSIARAPSSATA